MEQNNIGEYVSLQELGVVIDKLSFQSELPRSDQLVKDSLLQVQNPIRQDDEDEKDTKAATEDSTLTPLHNAVQFPATRSVKRKKGLGLLIPINRKTVERILLIILICAISTTVILPFFLLIGKSIQPWSSSVSYDVDEFCRDDNNITVRI